MIVRADMIIAGAAIHGRITIGADGIIAVAGDDVGPAIDIDYIVTRAGIDRGVAGLNPDAVVTGSADYLEKVQAGGRPGITAVTSVVLKGVYLFLQPIDGGSFCRRPRQNLFGAVRNADRGHRHGHR